MTDSSDHGLRQQLLVDYSDLKKKLARRLGSTERAEDALQDAWVRLDGVTPTEPIRRPFSYLFQVAYSLALKRLQKEREKVTVDDARAALDLIDESPDPEQVVVARSDLAAVRQALAELSPRRRQILLASRVEGLLLRDIAKRHGISQRMAELELKVALQHCGERLSRKIVRRFGPKSLRSEGSRCI
jgi:RNA polymerase sigma-70 factor (ECF subfamily)